MNSTTTIEDTMLRTEVTGYITAYWEQANDGHPYYAAQHPGKTTRDLALDYMQERYEDYLAGLLDTEPDRFEEITGIDQPETEEEEQAAVAHACDMFDRMFDLMWPKH